jgi:hypothetical protein
MIYADARTTESPRAQKCPYLADHARIARFRRQYRWGVLGMAKVGAVDSRDSAETPRLQHRSGVSLLLGT